MRRGLSASHVGALAATLSCSLVVAFSTLAVGYFVEDKMVTAAVSSLAMSLLLTLTTAKRVEGFIARFTLGILSILLGLLEYLVVYYLVAGYYVGPRFNLTALEYLLLFIRSGVFFLNYIALALTYTLVGGLVLTLVLAIVDYYS